MDERDTTKYRG